MTRTVQCDWPASCCYPKNWWTCVNFFHASFLHKFLAEVSVQVSWACVAGIRLRSYYTTALSFVPAACSLCCHLAITWLTIRHDVLFQLSLLTVQKRLNIRFSLVSVWVVSCEFVDMMHRTERDSASYIRPTLSACVTPYSTLYVLSTATQVYFSQTLRCWQLVAMTTPTHCSEGLSLPPDRQSVLLAEL